MLRSEVDGVMPYLAVFNNILVRRSGLLSLGGTRRLSEALINGDELCTFIRFGKMAWERG